MQVPNPSQSGVVSLHVEVQVLSMQVKHWSVSQVPQLSGPPQPSPFGRASHWFTWQVVGVQQVSCEQVAPPLQQAAAA